MIRKLLFLAVLIPLTAAFAQQGQNQPLGVIPSELWNNPIASVGVEGITTADTFLVVNSSGLVPGDILTAGMVQDAIKGIFALGLFSDVQIKAESARRGVAMTIAVTEYPKVRELKISGNKKLKRDKIKESLTLFEGRLASPEEVKNNTERVKALYAEKGYLLANVDIKRMPVEGEPGSIDLELVVTEGSKVKIDQITFSGNERFPDKKLRGQMKTKAKSFFRSGNFDRDKYLEDKDKVVEFYKNNGYIDAVVLSDSIWYNPDSTKMYIDLSLREGSRYYFGNITWEGNKLFANDKFTEKVKFKPGGIYDQRKYDDTIGKFHEMYQNEGYWYAQIEEKTIPFGDTLNFHLAIIENNPVHIRLVNVEGNTKTREKVIRRELVVKPNTIFKRDVLTRSIRELMILNFFSNVEPGWDILPNGDIDLKLKVTEKETGQFSVGAGYSATDKFVATIGLGIPNLFGTGQTASLDTELGKNRNTFNLSYVEPWLLDTPTSLSGSLYLQQRDWSGSLYDSLSGWHTHDWYTERRTGGDIQVGRRLRWPDNYFRVYAGYRLEQVDYYDITADYISHNTGSTLSIDKFRWPLTTSAGSLVLIRDSRDLPQFPTKGSVVSLRNELAGTILGGSWNYYKQEYTAEYYKRLFWKLVLMGRGKFGLMGGIHHGDADIPYSERFAPGGVAPDGTIRGYKDNAVGPLDPTSGYVRGRFELVYNLELTIPISEQQFYVLFFADAGNAYRTLNDIHLGRGYFRGVGPGFRVIIPLVGIMGFDFGYPFDGIDKGHWNTHFQIGRGF